MRTEDIYADSIEEAVELILNELKEDPNTSRSISSRNNIVYFDGWDGLGASAVLRAIAQRLTPTSEEKSASVGDNVPNGLEFEQVLHIDCSKWESRRALQKAVAVQLGLRAEVMEMFDKQDEEDDFRGLAQGSRAELQEVVTEMYKQIQILNRRFLLVLHNGGSEEINLTNCCGLPLSGFSSNKVLWTHQGRFRLKPRVKVETAIKSAGMTDVFLSACPKEQDPHNQWSYLVREEAEELVAAHKINTGSHGIIDQPAQVAMCFLYMLELCWRGRHSIDYDLATHVANYWICDGAIKNPQLGERDITDCDDGLWRTAKGLQQVMQLDMEYQHQELLPVHLARWVERKPYWSSPTCGAFLTNPPEGMFQHYLDKLCVLKLSRCTFDFPSPPFLSCHNLRFLWLDHCIVITSDGAGKDEEAISRCFKRLWVLDVRYTKGCHHILSTRLISDMIQLRELNVVGVDWDMGQLRGQLPNIRKLRVKNSTIHCTSLDGLLMEMNNMEFLDFSHNEIYVRSLYDRGLVINSSSLETVIIHGFIYYWLVKISFHGCTNLKKILLSEDLWNLQTLDISRTALKTLDLTTTIIEYLDELYLLDSEKLCAIMWPPEDKRNSNMRKLCIDTTQGSFGAGRSSSLQALPHGSQVDSEFDWYISVRDARLLSSLEPVYPFNSFRKIYVEISSPTVGADASKNEGMMERSDIHQQEPVYLQLQRTPPASIYERVGLDRLQKTNYEGYGDAPCSGDHYPHVIVPHLPKESCYMFIQDQGSEQAITVPDFVVECAMILHVRDTLSITILPSTPMRGSEWLALEWCRIERCPKLDCVFTPEHKQNHFYEYKLRIFWASQLSKARYIWGWSEHLDNGRGFLNLKCLHLHCCPRLIHVLPISRETLELPHDYEFKCLETLEIMWCGDLMEVFPLDIQAKDYKEENRLTTLHFPRLKRIHLHELPSLHSISDHGMMISAPELETVKIRGCWSLRRLPAIEKVVRCDCEKEWWDSLEWKDDASQKKLYRPIHSKYYKKSTLLRRSVLR